MKPIGSRLFVDRSDINRFRSCDWKEDDSFIVRSSFLPSFLLGGDERGETGKVLSNDVMNAE